MTSKRGIMAKHCTYFLTCIDIYICGNFQRCYSKGKCVINLTNPMIKIVVNVGQVQVLLVDYMLVRVNIVSRTNSL